MNKYQLDKLTIKEKIGQLMMFGIDGLELNEDTIKLIKEDKIGNIILFTRNIKTPEQLFNLTKNLQKLALEELEIPLFISVDQEGGMVTRIFNGATFFPGAMTISATNNKDNAYQVGKMMGKELSALGINMNLAPILDINNNPFNPVIGVRSYSDDKEIVKDFSWKVIKGLQEEGVFATGKHFPGHGDTNVDSHLGLPVINHEKESLNKNEFYPFKNAIAKGIKAIMSSHINFPNLTNDDLPATLSKKIMTDLLRKEFNFQGLSVSDGMGMKGIVDNYSTEEASLMAINAGMNLVCVCHPYSPRRETLTYLLKSYQEGRLSLKTINERVARVLKFKEELKVDLSRNYQDVKKIVENKTHREKAYQIVEDALTLVKGKNIVLKEKVLFAIYQPRALTIADDTDQESNLKSLLKSNFPNIEVLNLNLKPSDEEITKVLQKVSNYQQVILSTYAGNVNKEQIKLIEKVSEIHNDVYVVSFRDPYDLFHFKAIKNYLCLYEYTPNSIKVLIKYLKGEIAPRGVIPIKYE